MDSGQRPSTRVVLVDDDPRVRQAYRIFLDAAPGVELVGTARTGAEGVQAYAEHLPDVVLMDLDMPVMTGPEATAEICRRWPGACVVVLTTFDGHEHVVSALRAGAAGYLLKDGDGAALLRGMRQALDGEMPLAGPVRRDLVTQVLEEEHVPEGAATRLGLTAREVELLQWLAHGLTNHQIGTRMFVSEGSVKQYLTRVGAKLGVTSRTGILVRSIQTGAVDPRRLPPLDG